MKAQELMIGDWVIVKGVPTKIHDIDKMDGINREWIAGCEDGGCICYEDIQPILLTPEILEKNDILYEKQSFYYVINDDKDLECTHYTYQTVQEDWVIGVDTGAYDCSVFARIKYVHELQHALRLCGIDKEIAI